MCTCHPQCDDLDSGPFDRLMIDHSWRMWTHSIRYLPTCSSDAYQSKTSKHKYNDHDKVQAMAIIAIVALTMVWSRMNDVCNRRKNITMTTSAAVRSKRTQTAVTELIQQPCQGQ